MYSYRTGLRGHSMPHQRLWEQQGVLKMEDKKGGGGTGSVLRSESKGSTSEQLISNDCNDWDS